MTLIVYDTLVTDTIYCKYCLFLLVVHTSVEGDGSIVVASPIAEIQECVSVYSILQLSYSEVVTFLYVVL